MEVVNQHTDLVVCFRNGDETAIKQLYNQHYRALCFYAEQLVHDKSEAEDIAIDTFLKLINKRADFDNLPDIKSFLFTATRNACFDFLRKNKRKDNSIEQLKYLTASGENFGVDEMITAKVLQVIYTEVEKLPAQCKQVFKSIFIEGKNTAAIAAEMGTSTQTVLNQKSKALQLLRLRLYKEGLYSAGMFLSCLFLIGGHHRV